MSTDYDFQTLSPEDFERLVRDLLSVDWNIQLEIFKSGRDKGIDLRYSCPAAKVETLLIVQCKRYVPTGIAQLIHVLKKEELPKVRKLKPTRYVLATSVPLSVQKKDELLKLLSPWCTSSSDILGAGELNALLRSHPDVLKAHFKLWMSSTVVLESLLHAGIWNRTAATIEEIKNELSRYVIHDGLHEAYKILEKDHHCVIVGMPGIGKTTLAQIILCHYLQEGFQVLCVSRDVEEAWNAATANINEDKKLIIFYDDFLGQVSFEHRKFEKNEEHRLIALLKLVSHKANLRFLLTTREYILADAKRQHAALAREELSLETFTLQLGHYTLANRARILFNHLFFSDLPTDRIKAIVESGVYRIIIRHENFNPRIIRGICENVRYKALSNDEYIKAIQSKLDDPSEVWAHSFSNDIQPNSRMLLMILSTFGEFATLEAIRDAFTRCVDSNIGNPIAQQLELSLKELLGNFIRSERLPRPKNEHGILFFFQNPSIRDYVSGRLSADITSLKQLSDRAMRFCQIENIASIVEDLPKKKLPSEAKKSLYDSMYQSALRLLNVQDEKIIALGGERRLSTSHARDEVRRLTFVVDLAKDSNNSAGLANILSNQYPKPKDWYGLFDRSGPAAIEHFVHTLKHDSVFDSQTFETIQSQLEATFLSRLDKAYWVSDAQDVVIALRESTLNYQTISTDSVSTIVRHVINQLIRSDAADELDESELDEELEATNYCESVLGRDYSDWTDILRSRLQALQDEFGESEDALPPRVPNTSFSEFELDALFQELLSKTDDPSPDDPKT